MKNKDKWNWTTWTTWRWAIGYWWIFIVAILFFIPNYTKQTPTYYGTLHYADTVSYTLILLIFYSILPVIYWLLSWVKWLRKHFIIQYLIMIPIHFFMTILLSMGSMHNSSVAYFLLLWTMLIGSAIHLIIIPFIWWKLPRE